jgi:hypothetical protein
VSRMLTLTRVMQGSLPDNEYIVTHALPLCKWYGKPKSTKNLRRPYFVVQKQNGY